ncbi:ABC transporter permease [Thermodesulfobacterium hydrogeniphilum]|uniref:ABC transporter permease n=1 Tax=Thermodesulfobacterium hydrogeniphilum TaxID=161156 RepID=UPI0005714C92|nr:ABC transporter permease [Thermodesulfobacterium hydrogeniphilum]
MRGFLATYLRELLILKNRFFRFILSLSVNPALYIIAFGIGLGKNININGKSYLEFLIPGLIAATTMMQAFAINVEINISRFYLKLFEEFQAAPISSIGYALGEVFSGVTRAFLATFVILFIAFLAKVKINLNLYFFITVFFNAFIFASLGLASAMFIKSHADQALITNFIITPMMFLGGTFFPTKNLPIFIRPIIETLPLTLVSHTLRSIALNNTFMFSNLLILFILSLLCFFIAVYSVQRSKD